MKTKIRDLFLRTLALLTITTFVMAPLDCDVQWPPSNTETVVGVAIAE